MWNNYSVGRWEFLGMMVKGKSLPLTVIEARSPASNYLVCTLLIAIPTNFAVHSCLLYVA
jgi:hypothetical protein